MTKTNSEKENKNYIALLRGINISGKNKISMAELKQKLIEKGFSNVNTYLNSGNILFSSAERKEKLSIQISELIKLHFCLDIKVFIISQSELQEILSVAPAWWGTENKAIYDNLIFVFEPVTFSELVNKIGEAKEPYEKIQNYKNAIFWSFDRKNYQKTNWWSKTASQSIGKSLTIRTSNTVKHLAQM